MRVINIGPDPSLAYRPDLDINKTKEKDDYRNFESGSLIDRVFNTYKLMHTNQTLDFVKKKHSEWAGCNHKSMTMMDAVMSLDQMVDESDPDVDFPNSFHAFQTAEGIRQAHPDNEWFQLVGLIHDVGKAMALWGEQQWAVTGDTFPVGCKIQNSVVFRNNTFLDNPDEKNPKYNTEYGIYEPNCGLDKVLMSWGHDGTTRRYTNRCPFSWYTGLYMIRFHSFYPWHTSGDYMHLCNANDLRMLPWVQEFNKFDLYTKTTEMPEIDTLKLYYQSLIDKYCPGTLKW
uniref:Inositol oxygenase n=1 Tax=Gasterosteus aculeatus aculeatus TaxID=481459 RepID=G3PHJ2_GASAC